MSRTRPHYVTHKTSLCHAQDLTMELRLINYSVCVSSRLTTHSMARESQNNRVLLLPLWCMESLTFGFHIVYA
jgi:hypothetical protein